MNHDFIRLANDMRRAHLLGLGFRIPAMTMRQLTVLIAALDEPAAAPQLH
ncbi:hypothetical protein [Achromobacter kerstersii]|jgi:hypothetical protein|uniref:Uncharacterized protein n=1 Tax=Achromobacter kerstersii TaxID=1353890 RepID=A0A6S7AHG5_9BURK|nr:hypothetical protein [Achromobacter kerstersii]CAB3732555.1 hypothetical protein LMG3441_04825 [Achromobacter kerstersii]